MMSRVCQQARFFVAISVLISGLCSGSLVGALENKKDKALHIDGTGAWNFESIEGGKGGKDLISSGIRRWDAWSNMKRRTAGDDSTSGLDDDIPKVCQGFKSSFIGDCKKFSKREAPLGLLICILILLYLFVGIALVCDELFVPALEIIADRHELSNDVAGATLMAAGGSAPELATSLIGTFKRSDIGFGTIVGSAVFNVLFVIGCCAMFTPKEFLPLKLTWWPLFRDCTVYIVVLGTLAYFMYSGDGKVELWEAVVQFCLYLCYVAIMYKSQYLEGAIKGTTLGKFLSADVTEKEEKFKEGNETDIEMVDSCSATDAGEDQSNVEIPSNEHVGHENLNEDVSHKLSASGLSEYESILRQRGVCKVKDLITLSREDIEETVPAKRAVHRHRLEELVLLSQKQQQALSGTGDSATLNGSERDGTIEGEGDEEAVETMYARLANGANFLSSPDDSIFMKVAFIIMVPMYLLLCLIPECRTRDNEHKAYRTFAASIVTIGALTFFMVEAAEAIGATVGIPDVIMGMTVLAAGTSVPDLLSSIFVARQGEGDMAVSSSIGSNIFDVTVGLPLPWILFNALMLANDCTCVIVEAGREIFANLIVLVVMVCLVVCSIAVYKWKMTHGLGYAMFFFYFAYLTFAILITPTSDFSVRKC